MVNILTNKPPFVIINVHESCPLSQSEFWARVGCFVYKTFHVQKVFDACLEIGVEV